MQTDLGNNVLLIHPREVGVTELKSFFLAAHGTQLTTQFGLDKRTTLFYPWGVNQFGWYDKGTGFPLYEIMRNERTGTKQGLTVAGRFISKATPSKGTMVTSPLLHYDGVTTPDIELQADDLDAALCEKMLAQYYLDNRSDRFPVDIGIICLKSTSWGFKVTKKLSEVLAQLLPSRSTYVDVMLYCLCCSVKEGEERRAMAEASGYVQIK